MKLALVFLSLLMSLSMWFPAQETPPTICRGKPVPITSINFTGLEIWTARLPLRFGGTRATTPPLYFPSDKAFRRVIKNRDEFTDFGNRLYAQARPEKVPRLPDIDFSKEMVVVVGRGTQQSSSYGIFVDGACEVDGQVEVFVNNVDASCIPSIGPPMGAPADAVRLPRIDLPVVFRETQLGCKEVMDLMRLPKKLEPFHEE